MNYITITLYLSAMLYLNDLQAKLRPDGANIKGPEIVNNLLPHCNIPSRKKVEPELLCITSCIRGHHHINGPPVRAVAVISTV